MQSSYSETIPPHHTIAIKSRQISSIENGTPDLKMPLQKKTIEPSALLLLDFGSDFTQEVELLESLFPSFPGP
jgi:hypothetical protein